MLWVIDRPEVNSTVEMVKQFSRHLSSRKLIAALDAGQAGDIDPHCLRDIVESLVALQARFSEVDPLVIHTTTDCVKRKNTSSGSFAARALRMTLLVRDSNGDMEAIKQVEVRRGVGWAIKQLRLSRGLNQGDLAAVAGTDAANISRIERGRQNITEAALFAVAAHFGLTPSALYAIAESADPETAKLIGRIGQLKPAQVREVDSFTDYVLKRRDDPA